MYCDLEAHFGALSQDIPCGKIGELVFSFSQAALPTCVPCIATDRLVIRKVNRSYNSNCRVDCVWVYADAATYRRLALLTLSVLFNSSKVRIQLRHTKSAIRNLIVSSAEPDPFYRTHPILFNYYAAEVEPHPWRASNLNRWDLPCFYLSNLDDCVVTDADWETRDTIRGFGADIAMIRMAGLFLDAAHPQNKVREIHFEGDAGYLNIGRQSAEATFHLPGALGYDETLFVL